MRVSRVGGGRGGTVDDSAGEVALRVIEMSYRAAGAGGNAARGRAAPPAPRHASPSFVSRRRRARRRPRWRQPPARRCCTPCSAPGYVLDDWFTLRYARFDGRPGPRPVRISTTARPGAAAWCTPSCSGWASDPLIVLMIQAVIGAATAALLVVVFRSDCPAGGGARRRDVVGGAARTTRRSRSGPRPRTSRLCVLLAVAATALLRSPQRAVAGPWPLVLFAAAALCYEAVIPAGRGPDPGGPVGPSWPS